MVTLVYGNIFDSAMLTIVNPVNCVGVWVKDLRCSTNCAIQKCSRIIAGNAPLGFCVPENRIFTDWTMAHPS